MARQRMECAWLATAFGEGRVKPKRQRAGALQTLARRILPPAGDGAPAYGVRVACHRFWGGSRKAKAPASGRAPNAGATDFASSAGWRASVWSARGLPPLLGRVA